MTVIQKVPPDASLDEIVDALWAWRMAELAGELEPSTAANRLLALDPAELVMANRAARDASILGLSRQIALDVVQGLPATASVDTIIVAVAAWHWPDDATG